MKRAATASKAACSFSARDATMADRDPLEESLRELAAEDRRQHLVGEGAEEVEVNAAKWLPMPPPLDPPDDAERSGRGGNYRHAMRPPRCRWP
jgi:hypothetical protein